MKKILIYAVVFLIVCAAIAFSAGDKYFPYPNGEFTPRNELIELNGG